MALIENTLFGEQDRIKIAIKYLRHFEPKEGYWVAISGGKDSAVVYDLVHRSKCKAEYWHSLTTIDAPQTIKFIRKEQPDCKILYPKLPLLKRMLQRKQPPLRNQRWCCTEYKENGGDGRLVVTGVRSQESARRKNRAIVEHCFSAGRHGKRFLNIIIDWSESDVWDYIKKYRLPVNPLYSLGYKRIGCVFCPMNRNIEQQKKDFPKIYEAWRRAFKRLYELRIEEGLHVDQPSAEEWFQWWLTRTADKQDKQQLTIFENEEV